MLDLDALDAALAKATPEPWTGARLVNADGSDMTHDEIAAYVKLALAQSRIVDFYFAHVEKSDGPADVAHFGNGPTSAANLALTVALRNSAPALIAELRDLRARLAPVPAPTPAATGEAVAWGVVREGQTVPFDWAKTRDEAQYKADEWVERNFPGPYVVIPLYATPGSAS